LAEDSKAIKGQAPSTEKKILLDKRLDEHQVALKELEQMKTQLNQALPSKPGAARSNEAVNIDQRIRTIQGNMKSLSDERAAIESSIRNAQEKISSAPSKYEIEAALERFESKKIKPDAYLKELEETKTNLERMKSRWQPADLPAIKDVDSKIAEIEAVLKVRKK
jgi:chromosome segregation ATPase